MADLHVESWHDREQCVNIRVDYDGDGRFHREDMYTAYFDGDMPGDTATVRVTGKEQTVEVDVTLTDGGRIYFGAENTEFSVPADSHILRAVLPRSDARLYIGNQATMAIE